MTTSNSLSVFVLMPFRETFFEVFERAISPALQQFQLEAKLAPNIQTSRDVMLNIYTGIWESRLIIADLTDLNPNVLYELGIALTLNKQSILITQNIQELPFDLRRDRVLEYRNDSDGRAKLRNQLSLEIKGILSGGWTLAPSWKGDLNVNFRPVGALLAAEYAISKEAWILEPEESFQDKVFHEVILANLERGIKYKFIVSDHPDVEAAFQRALGNFYGSDAQVVFIPENRLQIPLSLAIFDPMLPSERAFQYLPNGTTVYGIPLLRQLLVRARRLFIVNWDNSEYRIVGERPLRW